VYCPVPVRFRIDVERRKDDGQDNVDMLRHEVENVFVVPVEQCSFRDLAIRSCKGCMTLIERDVPGNAEN
jgi:hypothetical protein